MKRIVPHYYSAFSCIAHRCRHSCCIGWEIDIDEDARERYRCVPGELGQRLQQNICDLDEGACFRLDESERCPFLNADNLCELILTLGEESLCQICSDHPRFRNFFSDRTEIGLGLCCEEAARLILSETEPMRLICLEDDGQDDADFEEALLLERREELFAIAQDRSQSIDARIDALLTQSGLSFREDLPHWSDFLISLERMDDAWKAQLLLLTRAPKPLDARWDLPFEQLLVCLLYRHLPGALEDGELAARIAYAAMMTLLLRCMFAHSPNMANLIELARLYSSEMEYSDENISKTIEEILKG